MRHRSLGARAEVSAIGRGTMGLTMAYEPIEAEAGIAALRRKPMTSASLSPTPTTCRAGALESTRSWSAGRSGISVTT